MSTATLVVIAIILFALVVFQLAKTTEFVAVLRGDEKTREESDRINGRLMMVFLIGGMIALFWSLYVYLPHMVMEGVTVHGKWIDSMFNVTLFFTGIVFMLCQVALFYFVWRYKHSKNSKALYYPENNKLEMWWTIIPAIVLTGLVVIGIYRWIQITGPEPPGSHMVEITGQQFQWNLRYPGTDDKLGNFEYDYIDDINLVGIDFNDEASKDDIVATNEIHVLVNEPTLLRIRSKDVIHDVGIHYFRVKMDAVPGIVTRFWFIPEVTTEEMRQQTGNPEFQYELTCNQLCGASHYSMRAVVIVDTPESYKEWMKSQKSFYETSVKGQKAEGNFLALVEAKKKKEAEKNQHHHGGEHE